MRNCSSLKTDEGEGMRMAKWGGEGSKENLEKINQRNRGRKTNKRRGLSLMGLHLLGHKENSLGKGFLVSWLKAAE